MGAVRGGNCWNCLAEVLQQKLRLAGRTLWLWSFLLVGFMWKMSKLSLGMLVGYSRSKG